MQSREIDYNNYQPLDRLLKFFDQNKEKIYITDFGTHPINKEGFAAWKKHLADLRNISRNNKTEIETYQKFAEVFEKSIRYIAFPEYLDTIARIAPEIMKVIRETDTVGFLIDDGVNKSNTWALLLFLGELIKLGISDFKDKVFAFSVRRIHPIVKLMESRPGSFALINFDDMTYSGNQMAQYDLFERKMRCKQPCPEDAYSAIKYYLAVPYTTSYARSKLVNPHPKGIGATYFENTVTIPTFKEQVEAYFKDEPLLIERIKLICDEHIEQSLHSKKKNATLRRNNYLNVKRGHNAFACIFGMGQTATYFDHKLADYISVMRNLIATGAYPKNITRNNLNAKLREKEKINIASSTSLIMGCDNSRDEKDCFKPFYKSIEYTYHDTKLMGKSDIIRQLIDIDTYETEREKRAATRLKKKARAATSEQSENAQ
jgi:hypothetical protein